MCAIKEVRVDWTCPILVTLAQQTRRMLLNTVVRIALLLLIAGSAMAQRQIDFQPFDWPASGAIVIPVPEGEGLTGLAASLDERTDGAISTAVAEARFTGARNKTLTLFGIRPYSRIDLIGVGPGAADRVGWPLI